MPRTSRPTSRSRRPSCHSSRPRTTSTARRRRRAPRRSPPTRPRCFRHSRPSMTRRSSSTAPSITAPESGTIVAVNVVPGTTAPSGDAIEMMTTELDVTADFAESDMPNIAAGQKATVTISATGDQVPGTVTTVEPVASTSGNSSVVSYSVTVALDTLRPSRCRACRPRSRSRSTRRTTSLPCRPSRSSAATATTPCAC